MRGIFFDPGVERLFCVSGGEFYELGEGGAATKLGDVATGILPVTWASNPANSRQFHYSRQFNGLEWDAFDVAQKANTPDVLRGLVVHDDVVRLIGSRTTEWSGRPGSLLALAPHRSGRAGSAASGSSTDGFATRRRVPAGPGSQAMATAIPKAYLASSAIRCRDVETGPNLGVLAVFPSTGATCRCPLPSTGSRGLNSPASAVL